MIAKLEKTQRTLSACADPEGETGGGGGGGGVPDPPLKNHKNIGSLSNTGLDPALCYKLQVLILT